jgi:putative flippase GtrA
MQDIAHPQTATRRLAAQSIRYLIVGAIAGGSDLLLNAFLTHVIELTPLQANLISRPFGGVISFTLNKFWTFGNRGQATTSRQAFRFCMVWLTLFAGSQALVWFYYEVVGLSPDLTKLSAEGTLGICSFLCQKFWTFR